MHAALDAWEEGLRGLCDELRVCARAAMRGALDRGALHEVDRPVAEGAGDVDGSSGKADVIPGTVGDRRRRRPRGFVRSS